VRAVAREVAASKVDHVVITGDLTNLALEPEFEAVRRLIEEELGFDADRVTIVPGNHDLYTRGAMRARRFTRFFEPYLESDLPALAVELSLGRFPIVKLRGPLAVIGLTSAVPRLPLVASGEIGAQQLDALARILTHDEVKRRTPILALHHPLHNPPSRLATWARGLSDASDLEDAIRGVEHGLLLHGHLHGRMQRRFATKAGSVLSVGATSASLEHEDEHRMAGFNVYEFDGAGALQGVSAHVLEPKTGSFRVDSVPKWV
jgi:3',5'-cyclic AMP phosphodiesterase CpdA